MDVSRRGAWKPACSLDSPCQTGVETLRGSQLLPLPNLCRSNTGVEGDGVSSCLLSRHDTISTISQPARVCRISKGSPNATQTIRFSPLPLWHQKRLHASFIDAACAPALWMQTAAMILQKKEEWKSITNPVTHGNPFLAVAKTSFLNSVPWCMWGVGSGT
ncbi:hypothetical protein EDD16DRAFT_1041474 [Pisolithus croceorrhizus]|nr:hypothetical protein EDD16DRAFT_1041474 [Pisolithus croceorrhizus]KAI6130218.1 hypothetical protein EV401DRAFT_620628 [Pisolithus croceorrhizus]